MSLRFLSTLFILTLAQTPRPSLKQIPFNVGVIHPHVFEYVHKDIYSMSLFMKRINICCCKIGQLSGQKYSARKGAFGVNLQSCSSLL